MFAAKLQLPLAAITDEYSPDNLDKALDAMAATGMTGAELRVLWGKNIMDLTDDELNRALDAVHARGMQVVSIASPLLKCVLPDAPPLDERFQHDVFASRHTYEDQPRLTERAFAIAQKSGARIVRVFSYWRTIEPARCFDRIVAALDSLARQAAPHSLIIGLENEHACNVSTARDCAEVLRQVNHPNLQIVWDPANAYISGEIPFPDGYRLLPPQRIAHVHAKDCRLDGHTPLWGPLGTRDIDWKGQFAALVADGYSGYISLETHWPGPGGDKFLASVICGENLRGMLS